MRWCLPLVLGILSCSNEGVDHLKLRSRASKVCPRVDLARLEGDWVQIIGATADGTVRMRISGDPTAWVAHHVDHLERSVLRGAVTGDVLALEGDGVFLSITPSPETCSLVATPLGGEPVEFLELPDIGVRFAYAPWTEPLALDLSGSDVTGTLPEAVPSDDDGCVALIDAWLDGVAVAGGLPDAPYTWRAVPPGDHAFELTRGPCDGAVLHAGARLTLPGGHPVER